MSQVALITGGGSGIGAAAARQLPDAGHRVAVTGRGEERLRDFAEELGRPEGLLTLVGDTAVYDEVRAAVDSTLTAFGRLDTVVANSGSATRDTVAEGDPDGWRDMVLTNVLGPALLIRASIDALKDPRADRPGGQRRRVRARTGQPLRGDDGGTSRSSEAESGGGP